MCAGAESSADDVRSGRGVVSSRAAITVRSIEIHPSSGDSLASPVPRLLVGFGNLTENRIKLKMSKMAFLGSSRKDDLKMLATELGLAPSDNLKIELKDLITNSDRYDEEFVKDVLSVIVEERTATEKQKAMVVVQQREKEFELEKMKILLEMQKLSQAPVVSQQCTIPFWPELHTTIR
ncbi:uncharacterized protein TNIN_307471 [Trichonephila inaurata madagascariensis]|uniref:Uncharacterized protein n=1 Tax=Trichonephila inaurata madagascariensis TaxID=2747483 RepID=A0A8X7C7M3_9ARAC|nr:uncharacterized protein TNIN_307471 [Trichonephila inaurata madagascariensis]